MEQKFEALKETKILVAEKDLSVPQVSSESKSKKETAKKILFENNIPEKRVELELNKRTDFRRVGLELDATKTFVNEKELSTVEDYLPEVERTTEVIQELEPKKEPMVQEELITFPEKEERPEQEVRRLKKAKPGFKSRLKIIFFGFIAVLTCFMGWSIYNSVHIETLRAQLRETNKIYAVNMVNYISNISKTDDLTSADSLYNLEQLSDAKILPIAPEIEPYVEYSVNSNWFDRICNWFSSFFR